jgi:site-specific recombinase XerD
LLIDVVFWPGEANQTATRTATKRQPDDNQPWQPPRGIRYSSRPGRPSPFLLHWADGDGNRCAAAYPSLAARETAAKALAEKRTDHGTDVLSFDPREWRRWLSFRDLIGDADPTQVAQQWLAAREKHGMQASILVSAASERYLLARASEGIAKATLSHAKGDMARFTVSFGTRLLGEIRPEEIRHWLAQLPFAEVTKRNHYKRVNAFFTWARLEGLATSNPCESIKSPARESEDVTVLAVTDVEKLFATAWKLRPQVCAKLALEAFAGLRFSSASRLLKDDINFREKGITLPAAKIKTRRRHYIDGLPANLWTWLRASPVEAWTLTERQYMSLKGEAFSLAGVTNPGNVLRHSFCSYHVAAHKDAARTAVVLCHASPSMLYQHYKGRVTERDARRYFNVKPSR